jgi:hypothetical protein
MKVNVEGIKLTDGQRTAWKLVHDENNKTIVLCFSRQSGKSTLAEILLIENLCKKNKFSAYISPTFALGRKIYKELMQLLEPTHIVKKANSSTLTIETTFGATLQFFSAEAYQAIRGFTVSGILIIDEAAYIPDTMPNGENFWGNIVMPITKARNPKVVLISTPCGKQGFFYDYYLRALNKENGIVQLTRDIYADNLVTQEQIEEIRKSIPPKAFLQEFECKFLDSSLTFFEGFENCFGDYPYTGGKEWIGVDLSSTANGDETILTKINEKNEVKQYNITGNLQMKYTKIADLINKSNAVAIYLENNGVGLPMIDQIKKLVLHKSKIYEWNTSNSSKEEIISSLAVTIANREIFFNNEDTELYSQFGTFICKISKTKKLTFAAQEGKHDDRIMSLAIALRCKEDFKYLGKPNTNFVRTNTRLFI